MTAPEPSPTAGSYTASPLNPELGTWVYVYNHMGTPYGIAGTVVGVEYTTHIKKLVSDGFMSLTLPPTSEYQKFPLYGDNSLASLGMVKDLMYAYYGGYDGGEGDYSHLILSPRIRDAITEQMHVTYDPTVQALLNEARDYNADTGDIRDEAASIRDGVVATEGRINSEHDHVHQDVQHIDQVAAQVAAALRQANVFAQDQVPPYLQQEVLEDTYVQPLMSHFPRADGDLDDTERLQRALNYCAANGLPFTAAGDPHYVGAYWIRQVSIPSTLTLVDLGGATYKRPNLGVAPYNMTTAQKKWVRM